MSGPGCRDASSTAEGTMAAALNAWSPMRTAMRCRDDGGERLERRDGRAGARSVGLGPLDVERRGEPGALPRGDEAQRLVVRRRDGAHGFELAQPRRPA